MSTICPDCNEYHKGMNIDHKKPECVCKCHYDPEKENKEHLPEAVQIKQGEVRFFRHPDTKVLWFMVIKWIGNSLTNSDIGYINSYEQLVKVQNPATWN